MEMLLTNNRAYKWFRNDTIYVKGYLFDDTNALYKDADLLNYFSQTNNENELKERLLSSNGFFSVIIVNKNEVMLVADRVRSMPLFYTIRENTFIVSDSANKLINQKVVLEEDRKIEFLASGFVSGYNTLINNVCQVQSGEIVVYKTDSKELIRKRYFSYEHKNLFENNEQQLLERLNEVYNNIINRAIKVLDGRRVILPLSGGLDSRLLLIKLKEMKYNNVLCYTYGSIKNEQVNISKYLADKYKIDWVFVEYTRRKWKRWTKSEIYKEYVNFAGNFTSISHFQDWPAILELKSKGIIKDNDVVMPGHTNDFIAGGHIPKTIHEKDTIDYNTLLDLIIHKHYRLNLRLLKKHTEVLRKVISDNLIDRRADYNQENASTQVEQYNLQERQCKFICNSLKVYEFFYLQWLIPYWDVELINFYAKTPINLRYGEKLFFQYIKNINAYLDLEIELKRNLKRTDEKNNQLKGKLINKFAKVIHFSFQIRHLKYYFTHFLQWYGIVSFLKYSYYVIFYGFKHVNSFQAKMYLDHINKNGSQNDQS